MIKNLILGLAAYTVYKTYCHINKAPEPIIPMIVDLSRLGIDIDDFLIESFVYADREHIGKIACVCKKWRDLTESRPFYTLMWEKHASEVFGEREWKRFYGDPGVVREIPQRLLRLYCRYPSVLMWKPSQIVRPGAEQPTLFNIRTIAEWSANPLPDSEGHAVNLDPDSWERPLQWIENDGMEEWLLVSRKRIPERGMWRPSAHSGKAHKLCKGEVARTSDVCLFLFTEKVKTGTSLFSSDPQANQIKRIRTAEKLKWTFTRIHEESKLKSYITVVFTEEGIKICPDCEVSKNDDTGFLVLWKEEEAKLLRRIAKTDVMTFG